MGGDLELRVEAYGRSVFIDGCEIAFASDNAAAELIALAINYVGCPHIPTEAHQRLVRLTA